MPKKMGYSNSDKDSGYDSAAKKGGASVERGLSSQNPVGEYSMGDAKGDHMPKGGSAPDYIVKKAGKTFKVC